MIIGSALGKLATNVWLPLLIPKGENAPFIQVDINQKIIARSFEVTQGIVGAAGAFINDLAALIPEFPVDQKSVKARKETIKNIKDQYSPYCDPDSYQSNSSPIKPPALMRVLQKTMPENTKIFIDAGNCVGWSVHYLTIDSPTSIFTSLSMGPMGFAVGAVLGAKMGCPDDTCICITGDGAFMMQGSEISTAAQNKVGAIWIVLSDNNLSMVSQGMNHFFKDTKAPGIWKKLYELGDPDLISYSRGLGAEAYSVNDPAGFEKIMPKILKHANKEGIPQVIIANVDRKFVPPYYNKNYTAK